MIFGNLSGLINGTEKVVFDYEVAGSAATEIATGNILNGDEDGCYLVILREVAAQDSSYTRIAFNGDTTGGNYGFKKATGTDATVNKSSATNDRYFCYSTTSKDCLAFSILKVYAKSGVVRLLETFAVDLITGTTVTDIAVGGMVWNNTADNLVSMTFTNNVANGYAPGTRIIILKTNNFSGGTPTGIITTPYIQGSWVRLASSILVSAASSISFTSLDGDRDVLYYISMIEKHSGSSGYPVATINTDGTNNYGYQFLRGSNTTMSAGRAATSGFLMGAASAAGAHNMSSMLLFAKQGFLRTAILTNVDNISGTTIGNITHLGQVFQITNTNITQIDLTSTAGQFDAGTQAEIYALRPNG